MEGKKPPGLLPKYFKNIGFVIIFLSLLSPVIINAMEVEMVRSQKELRTVLILNAFILGLSFVAWSRDQVEDEMTVMLRLKAMAWSFIWAVLYVIMSPVIDLLFEEAIPNLTGQQVVMSMLFIYLISYYLQKAGR